MMYCADWFYTIAYNWVYDIKFIQLRVKSALLENLKTEFLVAWGSRPWEVQTCERFGYIIVKLFLVLRPKMISRTERLHEIRRLVKSIWYYSSPLLSMIWTLLVGYLIRPLSVGPPYYEESRFFVKNFSMLSFIKILQFRFD